MDTNELWIFDSQESRWHLDSATRNEDSPGGRHGHAVALMDTTGGSRMYLYGGQSKRSKSCKLRVVCTVTMGDLWLYKFSLINKSGTWHKIVTQSSSWTPQNRVFASFGFATL